MIRKLLIIIGLLLTIHTVYAENFVVQQIKFTGLQRVKETTALSYLPIHIGQNLTTQDTINILNALYKTGFFSDVRLSHRGGTLIVSVKERPTIGLIRIEGNKEFTDKQLLPILKDIGIDEGLPYDSSKVNGIIQGLRDQYNQLGYYAVQIQASAVPQSRNRVMLLIKVEEGPIAKIRRITITGNQTFKEKLLLKVFASKPTAWWRLSFFSHVDRYSKTQLARDLDQLRNFYANRGYIRFQVLSQDVVVSPDNKTVDIHIVISEGQIYKIKGYTLQGLEAYPEEERVVRRHLDPVFKPGLTFSRFVILNRSEWMRVYFAGRGHAFPVINNDLNINDQSHDVLIAFTVNPGPVSYVRNVDFSGNTRTVDTALRNRVSQMEGSPYSIVDVEQSKARLSYLPYLSDVSVDTIPVPDKPDQVDLNYHLKEVNAGKASIQGGYSTSDGFIYGASLSEPNLLGTGKYGSLNFNAGQYQQSYSLTYVNPYYTTYGVSRSISIFSTITTPSTDLNYASYKMDGYGGSVTYGLPISLNNRLNLGFGYTYTVLNDTNGTFTSPTIKSFMEDHPSPYNQFKAFGSWTYSTLDRAVAPNRGFSQLVGLELGLPVLTDSLGYYKITEQTKYYYPLWHGFILNPNTSLGFGSGYGNVDTLPFFYNFYMGGIETLPGYAANSLGPRNPLQPTAALGGNLSLLGGVNLILPTIFTPKIRTALTFDAGNIFQTDHIDADKVSYENVTLGNIRMSVGILIIWYSPMGPLQFSAAEAINHKTGDRLDWPGFSFGASI